MDNIKLDGKNIPKNYVGSLKGSEATFDMVKKQGVWVVDKTSIKSQNSFNRGELGSFSRPNGHLHPNVKQFNGHKLSYTFQGVEFSIGKVNGNQMTSEPDMSEARIQGKVNGTIRNVVVTSNAIYLYNGSDNTEVRRN